MNFGIHRGCLESVVSSLFRIFAIAAFYCAVAFASNGVAAQEQPPTDLLAKLKRSLPANLARQKAEQQTGKQVQSLIVNGKPAKRGQFPWQVALILADAAEGTPFKGFYCGGSLIGWKWVLTAAHCTFEDNPGGKTLPPVPMAPTAINIYLGSLDFKGGERIDVLDVHRRNYNPQTVDNDIALLELAREPKKKDGLKLIRLIADNDRTPTMPGQYATAIGWGSTQEGLIPKHLRSAVKKLQFVRVRFKNAAECNKHYVSNLRKMSRSHLQSEGKVDPELTLTVNAWYPVTTQLITTNMMCAGGGVQGGEACFGDSGGPLVVPRDGDHAQAGIVSWGPEDGCGLANLHGVYTRVSGYLDWIYEMIK